MQKIDDVAPIIESNTPSFDDFGLPKAVLKALEKLSYKSPTPIQLEAIPSFMEGRDVLGQAQTGTGKTAAFVLPILARLRYDDNKPQCLILAPTRELAIQISDAINNFAINLKKFKVIAVCGGQSYNTQIQAIKKGAQIVVGTPGRVMDLIRKKALDLSEIDTLVLDEADEMLRMGFIDDVEWILEHTPEERQIGLFSATMPKSIQKITERYLRDPVRVKIESKNQTRENIQQKYLVINGISRFNALLRVMQTQNYEAAIVFAKTKSSTVELATDLCEQGYSAAALNGDVPQAQREKTIDSLKSGKIDVLIATDVAARGLDVERIGLVINYDMPFDAETYVHRIGRTGRANRIGDSILFVAQFERRYLKQYERASKGKIEEMELPSMKDINAHRIEKFQTQILETFKAGYHQKFMEIVEEACETSGIPPLAVAASIASMLDKKQPVFHVEKAKKKNKNTKSKLIEGDFGKRKGSKSGPRSNNSGQKMEKYRIEVGVSHGVRPGNIVGAITNESGLSSQSIGDISMEKEYSTLELPKNIPAGIVKDLRRVRVFGRALLIAPLKRQK